MTQKRTVSAVNQSPVVLVGRSGDKLYTLNKNNEAHCFKDPGIDQALCEFNAHMLDARNNPISVAVRNQI